MEKKYKIVPLSLKALDAPQDIEALIEEFPELTDSKDNIAGVVEGVASVFGNVDSYNDITEKGAFRKTILEHGPTGKDRIKLLPLHMTNKFPLGKILTLKETDEGLEFKSVVYKTDGELGGKNAWMLIKGKAVTELSYGFNTINSEYMKINDDEIRVLKEVQLWEISPVIWGANDQTRFKSANNEVEELKEKLSTLEESLEDIKKLITKDSEPDLEPEPNLESDEDLEEKAKQEKESTLLDEILNIAKL